MTAIRTDSSTISGLYGRGVAGVAQDTASSARGPQAFGDFSSFDGARFGLSGARGGQDPEQVASGVAQRLTDQRDNPFG